MNTEEIHLSNVIDYKRDIEPYSIIQLYSGVGSGKNTFIDQLIKGEIESAPKGLKVLLITSRRAKVNETLKEYKGESSLKAFCKWLGLGEDSLVRKWNKGERESYKDNLLFVQNEEDTKQSDYKNAFVCTGALVAAFFRYCYDPEDENTHLWNRFDMIVVDEAHSLIMDATYQDAPFHLHEMLLQYMYIRSEAENGQKTQPPKCKHIILMTGTPMLLEKYCDAVCPSNVRKKVLDVRNDCKCVIPKKVYFIEKRYVKKVIAEKLSEGKRVVYFSNFTMTPDEFCTRPDLPKDKTVVSFSDKDKRADFESNDPDGYSNMKLAEDHLRDEHRIPEQFSLFLTTERNKEGINIEDDFDYMFVESHISSDVIQMAGRVRDGVEVLYIVSDAVQNNPAGKKDVLDRIVERTLCNYDFEISDQTDKYTNIMDLLKLRNFERFAPSLLEEESEEMSQLAILKKYETLFHDYIEEKFEYIRYSYIDDIYKFFDLKGIGIDFKLREEGIWNEAQRTSELVPLVSSWFPGSKVSDKNEMYRAAWKFWKEKGIKLGKKYPREEFESYIQYWADLYDMNPYHYNDVLKCFSHFAAEQCGDGKKKRRFYDLNAHENENKT